MEDICEVLSVSKSSCYRWRRIFDEFGTVKKPPSPLVGRDCYSLCTVMTIDGYLGSFDSQEFYDFVAKDVRFYLES
ncbi:hypothetical protein AZE42_08043 [Rhizopogon vesiculosus]|uniref:Uncharacterized protein n=1 Tax=Rhizopogon vesiculosus TaxID=180088 RepID=A0A1J8R275_9AGAM|nr:hypothetical protein AZE42_08043 [Rhizopogon vesiculosus]